MPRSPAAPRRVRWRSALVVGLLVLALTPSRGAIRRMISAATGTAVQPAVRRGVSPVVSTGSSSVTTSTYFGSFAGNMLAKVFTTSWATAGSPSV